MKTVDISTNIQEKSKWSAPQIQLLSVTLDTSFGPGSGADGFAGDGPVIEETPSPEDPI